jgi:hypothetical protein
MYFVLHRLMLFICVYLIFCFVDILRCSLQKFKVMADQIIKNEIKVWRPSHVCFICGTLPTGTLIVCIPNLFFFFPPKERHNVGLLRFDDDHDHICYRLRRFKYLAEKVMSSNRLQIITILYLLIKPYFIRIFLQNIYTPIVYDTKELQLP